MKADSQHIKAIIDVEAPTDMGGFIRFLGMTNYVSKLIPNVPSIFFLCGVAVSLFGVGPLNPNSSEF